MAGPVTRVAFKLSARVGLCIGLVLSCPGLWGAGTREQVETAGKLTVYTAVTPEEFEAFSKAFTEATGIRVEYVYSGGAGNTVTRIRAERNNPGASVMFGGSADNYIALDGDGLLEAYQSANIGQIPESLRDPKGVWNPIYVGALAIGANRSLLGDLGLRLPVDWSGLASQEYARETGMGHPASSGTAYTILATLVQIMGENQAFAFLSDLRGKGLVVTKSTGTSVQAMALAERGLAIAFSHDLLAPRVAGHPVELIFPASGTGYEIGAVAIVKNGPVEERENARRFIDWLMSKEAQDAWAGSGSLKLPAHPESRISEGALPIDKIKLISYDFMWAGLNRKRLIDRFQEEIATVE